MKKDPISINIECQGCGKKRRKSVRFDGTLFCFTETPLGGRMSDIAPPDEVEFEMISLLDDIGFTIRYLPGKHLTSKDYRLLCRTCRKKVRKIKEEEDKKQRKMILEAFET